MNVFDISKSFPREEQFGLTSQIRRSSRSVCANLAESYRKRRYEAHFVSKLTDADMENSEVQVWLDFCLACNYVSKPEYEALAAQCDEVGRMLNHMILNPSRYS